MLISAANLADRIDDPAWVIFDCRHDLMDHGRGARLYREGHIPNAQFAPVETALAGSKTGRSGRHPLPDPGEFGAFLARHGVTPSSTIVAYDDAGGLYAARLWWLTRWIGHTEVHLLDGGLPKWTAEGRPLSTTVPVVAPAVAWAAHADTTRVWSADTVRLQLNDRSRAMIDARTGERFRGEIEPIDPVAGHIPGALHRFYRTNLNPDLTFRSPGELAAEFRTLIAGRSAEDIGHYCGSGITACANLFAMDYAGLTGSKLYPGSWSEWVSDASRPVASGR